eukprot:TRINITY_DN70588_c0_g1_i1.p1 TRINITY_DN70588_c0_g1~~TRINITY_DN70588_c0_g1_i1.p1  ORF type:complete len:341 (+),score=89.01 TRINITY_DN70588_c0_g1_i1:93-1115(+)
MAPKAKTAAAPAKAPAKAAPKQQEAPKAAPKAAAPKAAPAKPAAKAAPAAKPAAKQAKQSKGKAKSGSSNKPPRKQTLAIIYGLQFYGLNRDSVRALFKKQCGPVTEVSIRRRWGRRGPIKVLFSTEEAAKKAKSLDGKKFKGNKITVFLQKGRHRQSKTQKSKTVFVSGLPGGVVAKDVRRHFHSAGKIVRVRIYHEEHSVFAAYHPNTRHRPANSGRRGLYAYVYFANNRAARAGLKLARKPFKISGLSQGQKLFAAHSTRTLEQAKRGAEWAELVAKVFNPRLQERERAKSKPQQEKPEKKEKEPKAAAAPKKETKAAAPKAEKQAAKPAAKAAKKK